MSDSIYPVSKLDNYLSRYIKRNCYLMILVKRDSWLEDIFQKITYTIFGNGAKICFNRKIFNLLVIRSTVQVVGAREMFQQNGMCYVCMETNKLSISSEGLISLNVRRW